MHPHKDTGGDRDANKGPLPLHIAERRKTDRRVLSRVTAVIVVSVAVVPAGNAATRTWSATGAATSFSTPGNWGAGGAPGSGDIAVFDGTGTATCNVTGSTTISALTITGNATLALSAGVNLTVSGDYTQTSNTPTVNVSGGVLQIGGAFNQSKGTFTQSSGTTLLTSTSTKNLAATTTSMATTTFYNLGINDGLAGYWKLDDGTGATTAADYSGYGHTLTLLNTPTWEGSAGAATLNFTNSNAMILNGTSQHAYVAPTTALQPANFTIAMWVKRNGAQTQYAKLIIKQYNGGNNPYHTFALNVNQSNTDSGEVSLDLAVAGVAHNFDSCRGAMPDGTWAHIAASYDGANARIYANGVQCKSGAQTGSLSYDGGNMRIGQNESDVTANKIWFKGSFDDVRLYQRALADEEIYALYIGNQPGTGNGTQTVSSGSPIVTNDLILATGTLSPGSNSITVGGGWNNYGGIFTAGTGTVSLNAAGASSSKVIRSAGQPFYNLTLNGSGSTWSLEDWLKVNISLTMTNGALSPGAYAVHVADLNKSSGTFSAGTGTVVIDTTAARTQSTGFSFNNLRIETPNETSLIGYWKLDEGQGSTLKDASGNSNVGTMKGNADWISSGLPSNIDFDNHAAISLDGTSGNYASLGVTGYTDGSQSHSVSLWVYATAYSGTIDFASFVTSSPGTVYAVGTRADLTGTSGQVFAVWGAAALKLATTTVPSTSAWHHVAYTYDGTSHVNQIYVDGTAGTSVTSTLSGTVANAYLGTREGTTERFSGKIDDVRVYTVALTAAQVTNLYNGGYAGTGSGATVTLGANMTVNHTLAIDNGTLDTSSYTISAGGTDSTKTAIVNAGTLKIGSNTATFNAGLTVGSQGSVTEDTANGAISLATGEVLEYDEPSNGVVGFPTAAFDWSSFTFWRTYVTFSSYVGSSTADTVLAMAADGGKKYSWQVPSGSLLGTPRWNTEGGSHYVYVVTTTGSVYKLLDNGTSLATVSGWPYRDTTSGNNATATSPLVNDANNLYWSGNNSAGSPKLFILNLTGTFNPSFFSTASTVSAAPALSTISNTNFIFFAIANDVYQEKIDLSNGWINTTSTTTTVNNRVTVYNSKIYFPDNNGKVWGLSATSSAAPTNTWSYQDTTSTGHTGAACATNNPHVCPAVNNIYLDIAASRICFGDADGHIYLLTTSGSLYTGFPMRVSATDVITAACLSRNGVLTVGATDGTNYKVYEIDEQNVSNTGILTRTYPNLPGPVSTISYNQSASGGNGAYAVGTTNGKLLYLPASSDPTSGNP